MRYPWRMGGKKEIFDVMINVYYVLCSMSRQGLFGSCESRKIYLWEKVVFVFVVCSEINGLKLTQICIQGIFKFCQN